MIQILNIAFHRHVIKTTRNLVCVFVDVFLRAYNSVQVERRDFIVGMACNIREALTKNV